VLEIITDGQIKSMVQEKVPKIKFLELFPGIEDD
jgi:hypothetical protein